MVDGSYQVFESKGVQIESEGVGECGEHKVLELLMMIFISVCNYVVMHRISEVIKPPKHQFVLRF